MYNLLIDIGNSAIKIGKGKLNTSNVNLLTKFIYSKTNFKEDFKSNFEIVNFRNTFHKVGISILEDKNKKFLFEYFKRIYNIDSIFIDRNIKLPLKINYSKELGYDRICNAAAASKIFNKKNILIIDFGTATTYTMISNGDLIGGQISPGIKTALKSLLYQTSLPEVNLSFPIHLISNNTISNIKSGILFQSLYSMEKIIEEIKKNYEDLFVVATGGYSNLIATKSTLINKIDKNLVLKGINILIANEDSN